MREKCVALDGYRRGGWSLARAETSISVSFTDMATGIATHIHVNNEIISNFPIKEFYRVGKNSANLR